MSPSELGLPGKFDEKGFREIQRQMAEFALLGPRLGPAAINNFRGRKRWTMIGAAPGAGKSVLGHMVGRMAGVKYAVVTATRALEDQQVKDAFAVTHIQGRANYDCVHRDPENRSAVWSCEEGYEDRNCPYAGTELCTYKKRLVQAENDPLGILTNYMMWMGVRSNNPAGFETENNPIELLVLDEFHLAEGELRRFLGCRVTFDTLQRWSGGKIQDCMKRAQGASWGRLDQFWLEALAICLLKIEIRLKEILEDFGGSDAAARKGSRQYRGLLKLQSKLTLVAQHGGDVTSTGSNWYWQQTKDGISFEVIWAGRYFEKYVWSGVPWILCMSATLRPKGMELAGVSAANANYKEWPRVFKAELAPVYWIPTGILSQKATEEDRQAAVNRADEIYEAWAVNGMKRGLVYTASYQRAEWLRSRSKFGRYMILNKKGENAAEVADRYRKTPPPVMLVSASYGTGFDFPDEDCEWVHILKLPFPDRNDPLVLARGQSDRRWYDYATMQSLVQICGRGNRHERDRCVYMITDDAVGRFRNYARVFAPNWFRVDERKTIPLPGGQAI